MSNEKNIRQKGKVMKNVLVSQSSTTPSLLLIVMKSNCIKKVVKHINDHIIVNYHER